MNKNNGHGSHVATTGIRLLSIAEPNDAHEEVRRQRQPAADCIPQDFGWLGGAGAQADQAEARAAAELLLGNAGTDPATAILGTLNDGDQVGLLAVLAEREPAKFEAMLLALRQRHGARAKDVEALQRAVRATGKLTMADTVSGRGLGDTYVEEEGGIVWLKATDEGPTPVPLTNFTARIVEDICEDDGVEQQRWFQIQANIKGRECMFVVPAEDFCLMGWPINHIGAGAVIAPGCGNKDRTRAAIQVFSGDVPPTVRYGHTGWREIDGQHLYLHAGGAIGPVGPVAGIGVSLGGNLSHYRLPDPPQGEDLVRAMQATLSVLEVAPHTIVFPLLAATFRAAICQADFNLFLVGPTGAGKSELAALAQQHFGPEMDARNFPASFDGTANALVAMASVVKDAVLVVDDLVFEGARHDMQRMQTEVVRFLRALGNNSGRARMRADTSLRPDRRPRGLALCTAEQVPRGQSILARGLILDVPPDALNWTKLTELQRLAREGLLAATMAAFVRWLAARYDKFTKEKWKRRVAWWLKKFQHARSHNRVPMNLANLAAGWLCFLNFATAVKAIDKARRRQLWDQAVAALHMVGQAQGKHQANSNPALHFLQLLTAAVAMGRAHLAGPKGGAPHPYQGLGWQSELRGEEEVLRPLGGQIGWIDGDDVYLDPEASYAAAQRLAADSGETLAVAAHTLRHRLKNQGLLATTDENRGKLVVRVTLEGDRRKVLHIAKRRLFPSQISAS